jgi:hypothetical protein
MQASSKRLPISFLIKLLTTIAFTANVIPLLSHGHLQTLQIPYHGFTHGGGTILVESQINFARVATLLWP